MEKFNGNRNQVALFLGLSERCLRNRIKRYDELKQFRVNDPLLKIPVEKRAAYLKMQRLYPDE